MRTSELNYQLPRELIAQHPAEPRDASKLLVFDRESGQISHHVFRDLPQFLSAGDCLVINESRVIPCRLVGTKVEGGARIEVLLLESLGENRWNALAYRSRRLRPGIRIRFADNFECVVREDWGGGSFVVELQGDRALEDLLEQYGEVPLPPYIERPDGSNPEDRKRYQTVYARNRGSSAAPTAGLHFTSAMLQELERSGIRLAKIVLHIGLDTFQPIQSPLVEDHPIHTEQYEISDEAAQIINEVGREGGKVIAVGTTSVRTLETAAVGKNEIAPGKGRTTLFIRPGYSFQIVQAMITNFHLPETSLLALVATFAGVRYWRPIYEEAIRQHYRFYSYGDAMFIL